MNMFGELFSSKYTIIPGLSWLTAQLIKVLTSVVRYRRFDITRLVGTGGMPSSHAAYVVSLAAVVGKNLGVSSAAFGIAFAFAIIVMSDAAGVRRAAGNQAKLLNALMSTHFPGDAFNEKLKELIGHQPLEVFVGASMGLLFGIVFG
jgi:acid phosphatase family membrane protein YuiD